MKIANILIERFRDIETSSRGKLYPHRLTEQLQRARAFAARVDQDGSDIIYLFPDRSRLRVNDPTQLNDKATFYILSNVG